MATQEQVTVRYWTWCRGWLGIPYPCRKTRTETQWCYEFAWVKVTKWGIYCQYEACEAGKRYQWSDWYCLGVGTGYVYNVRRCFRNQRDETGTCTTGTDFVATR